LRKLRKRKKKKEEERDEVYGRALGDGSDIIFFL